MVRVNLLAIKKMMSHLMFDENLWREGQFHTANENNWKQSVMANVLDDEAIIRNALRSNPESGFELIFRKYYKPLCSHAVRYVYSKEAAEDIVSDVFINFWRNKNYENVKASYRAYLYQALRNTVYNYLKNEFGKKSVGFYLPVNEEADAVDLGTPQRILLFDELNNKVKEAVNSFSPQCQRVFILSRYEGKKNKEIAEELNIKIKTVEAHMMKALNVLRSSLVNYLKN